MTDDKITEVKNKAIQKYILDTLLNKGCIDVYQYNAVFRDLELDGII